MKYPPLMLKSFDLVLVFAMDKQVEPWIPLNISKEADEHKMYPNDNSGLVWYNVTYSEVKLRV